MRETILLMGGDEGLTAAVRRALAPLKILVRTVPPERYGDSLGYLAGDRSCPQADAPGEALEAPLLVLAGLDGGRMGRALDALERAGLRFDYKAMLTPINRFWDVPTLYAEIVREHEQMTKRGGP